MIRTMIITILMILTMITVGCGKKEPIITNDLLHREMNAVSEVSAISQYQ
jgi:hypothetical protein